MRRGLLGILLAGCSAGGDEPPVRDGVYLARLYDRVGECDEYGGAAEQDDIPLGVTVDDLVLVDSAEMLFYGFREGDGFRVAYRGADIDRGVADGRWTWAYLAEMAAGPDGGGGLAGTIRVTSTDTYRAADGREWSWSFEEEWSIAAVYSGPPDDLDPGAPGLWGALDGGYCP